MRGGHRAGCCSRLTCRVFSENTAETTLLFSQTSAFMDSISLSLHGGIENSPTFCSLCLNHFSLHTSHTVLPDSSCVEVRTTLAFNGSSMKILWIARLTRHPASLCEGLPQLVTCPGLYNPLRLGPSCCIRPPADCEGGLQMFHMHRVGRGCTAHVQYSTATVVETDKHCVVNVFPIV